MSTHSVVNALPFPLDRLVASETLPPTIDVLDYSRRCWSSW